MEDNYKRMFEQKSKEYQLLLVQMDSMKKEVRVCFHPCHLPPSILPSLPR